MCDFAASTDIATFHPEWDCVDGIPVTDPCPQAPWGNAPWYGLSCDENFSVNEWELYDLTGVVSGTLPNSIGSLSYIRSFDFKGSNMSGTIPSAIAQWSELGFLQIAGTSFSGTLPNVSSLPNLTFLGLINSKFIGTIPSSYGDFEKLREFTVYGNHLTGTIPETLGNNDFLTSMYFTNNLFSGSIPSSLCDLTSPYIDLHLTTDEGVAEDENPNIECYPKCLQDIYELVANGIPVCP